MSRSLNKAILIGNLGKDPEIRTTGGGTKVAEFSVATSQRWNDRNGQSQEKTEWHRIIAWEKLADLAEQYAKKGDKIYLEGEIQYRQYDDKDGNTRYITEIRAREIILLGGRDGGQQGGGSGGGGGYQASRQPAPSPAGGGGKPKKDPEGTYDDFSTEFPADDDDLPF